MCNSANLFRWQLEAIEKIVQTQNAELVLLIKPDEQGAQETVSHLKQLTQLPFKIYNRFWVKRRGAAYQKRDASSLFSSADEMLCKTIKKGKWRDVFEQDDIEKLNDYKLDFVLRFAFNILHGEILNVPKYGIWSFHHGDEQSYRGSPPGFWEVYNKDPVTGVILQRLTEKLDSGVVMFKGYFATQESFSENVNHIHMQASFFAAKMCESIIAGEQIPTEATTTSAPIYVTPNAWQMCAYKFKRAWRLLHKIKQKLFYVELWNIGVADGSVEDMLNQQSLGKIDWLIRDVDARKCTHYLADPFGYEHEGKLEILAEDYSYPAAIGTLSKLTYAQGWKESQATPYHREKEHLSYPSIIDVDGKLMCLPEIAEAKEVRFYDLDKTGGITLNCAALQGVAAVDTSYIKHGEHHWLFLTRRGSNIYTHLEAYYADDITGEWKPHAQNPLICDVRSARMAGNFLQHEGKLYRPGQDCSRTYGGAVTISRIDKLTPTEYAETQIGQVTPDPSSRHNDGLHTLSRVGNHWVLDGKYQQFTPLAWWHYVQMKLAAKRRK